MYEQQQASSNGKVPSIFYSKILEPGSQIFPNRTERLDQQFSIAFGLQEKFPSRGDNPFMVSLDLLRFCFLNSLSQNFHGCGA